jgi:hypothetical protein
MCVFENDNDWPSLLYDLIMQSNVFVIKLVCIYDYVYISNLVMCKCEKPMCQQKANENDYQCYCVSEMKVMCVSIQKLMCSLVMKLLLLMANGND